MTFAQRNSSNFVPNAGMIDALPQRSGAGSIVYHAQPLKASFRPKNAPVCRRVQSNVAKAATVETAAPAKPPASSSNRSKNGASISPEVAADLLRDMVLGREFEEMCAQMYYRGKMFGFVHLYSGQEVRLNKSLYKSSRSRPATHKPIAFPRKG